MNRIVDTRILAVGLLIVLGLTLRPIDAARAAAEITGSIPHVAAKVLSR